MVGSALNPDNSGRNNPLSVRANEWKGDVIEHSWSEVGEPRLYFYLQCNNCSDEHKKVLKKDTSPILACNRHEQESTNVERNSAPRVQCNQS